LVITNSNRSQRFLQETLQKTLILERLFLEIKSAALYPGARTLLSAGAIISKAIRESIKLELSDRQEISDDDLIGMCTRRQRLLNDLHTMILNYAAPAVHETIPVEMISALEAEIRKITSDFCLLMHPSPDPIYEIIILKDPVQHYIDALAPYVPEVQIDDAMRGVFIVLSYPAVESQNALLHTLMASHEIMHLKDLLEEIGDNFKTQINIPENRVKGVVDKLLRSPLAAPSNEKPVPVRLGDISEPSEVRSSVLAEIDDIVTAWLHELVADILAVRTYGPAYPLALARIAMTLGSLDAYTSSHPSPKMRLKIALEELRTLGFDSDQEIEFVSQEINEISLYVKDEVLPVNTLQAIAWESIDAARISLAQKVRIATNGQDFRVEQFGTRVNALVDSLSNGVPPCEFLDISSRSSIPADLPSILNAGWIFYLVKLDNLADLLGISQDIDKFQAETKLWELLLSAIDSAQFLLTWKEFE